MYDSSTGMIDMGTRVSAQLLKMAGNIGKKVVGQEKFEQDDTAKSFINFAFWRGLGSGQQPHGGLVKVIELKLRSRFLFRIPLVYSIQLLHIILDLR